MIDQQFGRFHIESELGAGGMGTVYAAVVREGGDGLEAGDRVAVKVVHPHLTTSKRFFARFAREAELGMRVRHPNVVRTLDVGQADGRDYLVMELVEGQTLKAELEAVGRLPEQLCRHVGREVSQALAALHSAGAVHRDVKPENVIITPDNVVKVMDLGVARLAEELTKLSQTGAFVGSLEYGAPEQFVGGGSDIDHRVDLHGVGLVLHEIATGQPAFTGADTPELIRRILKERPPRAGSLNPQLSPFLEEVIATLLEKDPEDRFPSAAELAQVLDEGEASTWWTARATALRAGGDQPLRRARVHRETTVQGRDGELERLRTLHALAADGDGQVVLLEGEAGIGKTRMVDEFVRALADGGEAPHVLYGSYPPAEAATASSAFCVAYLEHFGEEGLEDSLRRYLGATPLLVPAFAALLAGDVAPPGAPALTDESIRTVFVHATRALAAERPTIVVIDDLHFAPQQGRSLFASLAMAVPGHRVMLIGTLRPGVPEEWLGSLDRLEQTTLLPLDRLDPDSVGRVLAEAFRSDTMAEELGQRIAREAGGNPFFVFEILRELRASGRVRRGTDGAWEAAERIDRIEVPSSVLDLVRARLSELSSEDRDLLDVAACCGFSFDPLLVGTVLGLGTIPVLQRLARIEQSHRLVHSVGRRYVFDHHQVQEALYGGLFEPLREAYHAGIAEALEAEARDDAAATLCEHYFAGARGESALPHLDRALDQLGAASQHDTAAALAGRALDADLVTGTSRAELLLRQADHLEMLGRADEEYEVIEEALAIATDAGDTALELAAQLDMGEHLWHVARPDDAQETLRRALALAQAAGDERGRSRAFGLLGLVLSDLGRNDEAQQCHERRLAVAKKLDDKRAEAVALRNLGTLAWGQARYDEAKESWERDLELSQEIGDRREEAGATGNLGLLYWSLGDYDEAIRCQERQLELAREIGDRRGETNGLGNLGIALTARGLYARAIACHEQHFEMARETGTLGSQAIAIVNIAGLLLHLGDAELSVKRWHDGIALSQAIGNARVEVHARTGLAEATLRSGDLDGADALLREAETSFEQLQDKVGLANALQMRGEVAAAKGDVDEARHCLERSRSLAAEADAAGLEGTTAAQMAKLGFIEPSAAVAAFDRALGRSFQDQEMEMQFLLWQVTGEPERLEAAHRILTSLVDNAPERYREPMGEFALHRDIATAWAQHAGA